MPTVTFTHAKYNNFISRLNDNNIDDAVKQIVCNVLCETIGYSPDMKFYERKMYEREMYEREVYSSGFVKERHVP